MGGRRTPFSAGTTTPIYETQASHVVYPVTRTHVRARVHTRTVCVHVHVSACTVYVCSRSVRRVELVDDPGDVNDFHGKFSPPKMAKPTPPAGVSRERLPL